MPTSGLPDSNRLLIVQPYIPAYRVPLFAQLRAELERHGIELAVAAAHAGGGDASRGDDTTAASADFVLEEHRVRIGPRLVLLRKVGAILEAYRPSFVIVEQAIKNAESWPLLLGRGLPSRPSVAMWGQGRSYSTSQSAVEAHAKQWLTKRADWFFAYTQAGADYVVEHGFPRARTTVLRNSTDTRALRTDLAAVSAVDLVAYRAAHGLTSGRTALFLGGVDKRKGIPFLLESAREVARRLPGFTLLVGGSGEMDSAIEREERAGGPVRHLGRIDGRDKACALAVADLLMVPEWVGLVAVDSLASGTPIVTTRHPSHSPEVDYLIDGETAMFSDHTVDAYASTVVDLLGEKTRLDRMGANCLEAAAPLSIGEMTHNFVRGVQSWTAAGPSKVDGRS